MASVAEILVRSRTIATQMGGDANQSPLIDDKAGLYALLRNALRAVYRRYAGKQKFISDINVKHTVTMSGGTGDLPDAVIREFLHQAQFQDTASSLITYFPYAIDQNSGQNFRQLGYVTVTDGVIYYTAPAPTISYSGNLYVIAPSIPEIPSNETDEIDIVEETLEDTILLLAQAIRGEVNLLENAG